MIVTFGGQLFLQKGHPGFFGPESEACTKAVTDDQDRLVLMRIFCVAAGRNQQ